MSDPVLKKKQNHGRALMGETTRRDVMLGAAGAATVSAPEPTHPNADLMMSFCSLGRNCELGQAQRNAGAEPIDLLRWAGITSVALIKGLMAKFEGLSDPANVDLYMAGKLHMALSKLYHFNWHAQGVGSTAEDILDRECKRVAYLTRKFLEDIALGERIFVLWDPHEGISQGVARQTLSALQIYGQPQLLYVTDGAPISVTREGDHLMHGTLPKFADPTNVAAVTPTDYWVGMCEMVHREGARPNN